MVFKKCLPPGVPNGVIQSTVTFSDNLPDFFENFLKGRDTSKYYCHPYEESGEHIPERYRETFLKARGQWVWENYLQSLREKTEEVEPFKSSEPIVYNSAHFVDEVGELNEETIKEKDFLMKHKFTLSEFKLEVVPEEGKDVKVAAVEALSTLYRSRIANLKSLATEMRAMTEAASIVGLCGSAAAELRLASEQCARVLVAQQKLEQYLQSVPTLDETIRALVDFAYEALEDTKAMISRWSAVHHSIADLGEIMVQQDQEHWHVVAANTLAKKKSQKPLFFRRQKTLAVSATEGEETDAQPPMAVGDTSLSPLLWSQQEAVSSHWTEQMRSFAVLARAFKRAAMVTDRFSMLRSINGLVRYNDEIIQPAYAAAKKVYISSKALRHLHQQIDYRNSTLALPKGNALTTEEDRLAVHRSIGPLFARHVPPSDCTLVYEGFLTEYIPSSSLSSLFQDSKRPNKKKPTRSTPKEYKLIVANGVVYFCEVVPEITVAEEASKKLHSRRSVKAGMAKKASAPANPRTSLRLVHEPVLVIDAQISSTPDVVHPQYGSRNIIMLCFYNETSYILQAKSAEDRDAWIKCARALNIEQPKPTPARRVLDEKMEELYLASQVPIQATPGASAVDLAALASKIIPEPALEGSSSRTWLSLGNCVKVVGRAFNPHKRANAVNGVNALDDEDSENGDDDEDEVDHPESKLFPIEDIPRNDQEKAQRHFNMARCEIWDIPKVPIDGLMIRPTLKMMNARGGTYIHARNAEVSCTRSGLTVNCEFGFGLEDSADLQRLKCPIYTLHMPCRRNYGPRGPGEKRRDEEGNEYIAHPPEFIDCYGHGFLNPQMYIKFNAEQETISFLGLYIIKLQSSEMVENFEKVYRRLMSKYPITSDNVLLEVDRSEVLQVFKKTVRPFTTLPEEEVEEHLEAGREWYPLGDCHLEFRKMSQYPKATCIGFFNPITKRDHANGVLLLDSKLSRDTAMALGPKWMNLLGQTNGYERVSATEMRLTLWQTNPVFKDRILYGVYVCKQVIKYKSLEVYKIHGPADKLDSVQDFIFSEMNRLTDLKTIEETLELASVAFQSHIMEAPVEIEPGEPIKALPEKSNSNSHPELVILKTASNADGGGLGSHFSGHRMDCYLETVPEEDEPTSSTEMSCTNEPLISSTATFFPKSKSALQLMYQKQQVQEENMAKGQPLSLDASSFGDLTSDSSLSHFMDCSQADAGDQELVEPQSVADLTKFWAKTTSAVITVKTRTSCISLTNFQAAVTNAQSEITTKTQNDVVDKAQGEISTEVIQATRYLGKARLAETVTVCDLGNGNEAEPGIDMEHTKPVQDLRRQWEAIHRHGI
ncbi:hypothetical protein EMPS_09684 [Entomortierella parvispora]|uniref:PH domain-containing protein n=1 Tax=Entomortierella parvispora TaxID=205924 RepID=A0A9P3HII5_9FUNG|nr:hypothetical protein EMPS_09684 [Entomortierella parvispora]